MRDQLSPHPNALLYVVPPVPGATQRPPKPTKRNMWNHVRGIVAVTPRETPQFCDVAPTLHDLRWRLTQATSTAETDWVLRALREHVKTTHPRDEPAGPRVAPKRPRLLKRHLPELPWSRCLDTTRTLQLATTVAKTRCLLTTLANTLLLSSWDSKMTLMVVHLEHRAALEYTQAKEQTHWLYLESARRLQESAWLVQRRALHRHAHRRVIQQQMRTSLQNKEHLAYSVWMRLRLQDWSLIQGAESAARFLLSTQHVVELEQVTGHRIAGQYDAGTHVLARWRYKRPRLHEASPPPKRPRFATPAILEPPEDMRPMEVPLEDWGDAIVLTGL